MKINHISSSYIARRVFERACEQVAMRKEANTLSGDTIEISDRYRHLLELRRKLQEGHYFTEEVIANIAEKMVQAVFDLDQTQGGV